MASAIAFGRVFRDPGPATGTAPKILIIQEINDNLVAHWHPAEPFRAGTQAPITYRLKWGGAPELPDALARVVCTRSAAAYQHGLIATIDFAETDALPADRRC